MKTLVLFLTIAVATAAQEAPQPAPEPAWPQEPSDFRKVPFGTSMAETNKLLKTAMCRNLGGQDGCIYHGSIGDVQTTELFLFGKDGLKQVSISFTSDKYEFIRDAFVERYGEPLTKKTEPIRTKAGVEYQNEEIGWIGKTILISVERYGSKVTESSVMIADRAWLEAANAALEEKKKKAAQSF